MSDRRKALSKQLRLDVYNKFGGHCAYCGKSITLKEMQVDHINSVAVNGEDDSFKNLYPSCRKCNWSKHEGTINDFRETIAQYVVSLNLYNHDYQMAKRFHLINETNYPVEFYCEQEQEVHNGKGYGVVSFNVTLTLKEVESIKKMMVLDGFPNETVENYIAIKIVDLAKGTKHK